MTRVALKEAQKRYLRTLSDRLALTDTDNCLSVECAGLLQVLQDLLVIPSRIPYIRSRHWLCFDRWVWLRRCKKSRRGYFAFLHICTFCSCLVKKNYGYRLQRDPLVSEARYLQQRDKGNTWKNGCWMG